MVRPIINKNSKKNVKVYYDENINDILNPLEEEDCSLELVELLAGLSVNIKELYPEPIWIKGEISGFKKSGSHYYFDLVQKDEHGVNFLAKISAKIWASNAPYVLNVFKSITGKEIGSGIKSEWLVKMEYHPKFGFSVTVQDVKPIWTVGDHELKKSKIREDLKKETLFDIQKTHFDSPDILTRIAILSPSGAAGLGDFKSESEQWNNAGVIKVDYFNAVFEGENTNHTVSNEIKKINSIQKKSIKETGYPYYDLFIVLRGGGSKLSLAWLDDYDICKEICLFSGPVWSAIGHEQDFGLLDEVSLKNFHTPSKAAQKIWEIITEEYNKYMDNYSYIINESNYIIKQTEESIDNKLKDIKKEALFVIEKNEIKVDNKLKEIKNIALQKTNDAEKNINSMIKLIVGLGPSETLKRGYAIVVNNENKLIKSSKEITDDFKIKWVDSEIAISHKNIKGK